MTPDLERARSFGAVAEAYHQFRPPLPAAVATTLGVAPGTHVCEVAAGTGLATRSFAAAGATVIAVEPDDQMRAVLSRELPGVTVRAGVAEALPVDDGWADLVVAVAAWHWFDHARALPEFHRVLRPDGRLVVIRNGAVRSGVTDQLFGKLRRPVDAPATERDAWRRTVHEGLADVEAAGFSPFEVTVIEWAWPRTATELVAWLFTYSNVIIASDDARAELRAEAERQSRRLAPGGTPIDVAMVTEVAVSRRRPAPVK